MEDPRDRTKRLQHDTGTQHVTISQSAYAQTNRPESYRNQWIQTEPQQATEDQLKEIFDSVEIKKELKGFV